MVELRMTGDMIRHQAELAGITDEKLCEILSITQPQLERVYCGRAMLTLPQTKTLAGLFGLGVRELMEGDEAHYNQKVVHCMRPFEQAENREEILDIIDVYIDIKEALGE